MAAAAISPETATNITSLLNQITTAARELAGPTGELNRDGVLTYAALSHVASIQMSAEYLTDSLRRAQAASAAA